MTTSTDPTDATFEFISSDLIYALDGRKHRRLVGTIHGVAHDYDAEGVLLVYRGAIYDIELPFEHITISFYQRRQDDETDANLQSDNDNHD